MDKTKLKPLFSNNEIFSVNNEKVDEGNEEKNLDEEKLKDKEEASVKNTYDDEDSEFMKHMKTGGKTFYNHFYLNMALFGSILTGKTFLVKDLILKDCFRAKNIFWLSKSNNVDKKFNVKVKENGKNVTVYEIYSKDVFNDMLSDIMRICRNYRKAKGYSSDEGIDDQDCNFLVVMDDLSEYISKSEVYKRLLDVGRHDCIHTVSIFQNFNSQDLKKFSSAYQWLILFKLNLNAKSIYYALCNIAISKLNSTARDALINQIYMGEVVGSDEHGNNSHMLIEMNPLKSFQTSSIRLNVNKDKQICFQLDKISNTYEKFDAIERQDEKNLFVIEDQSEQIKRNLDEIENMQTTSEEKEDDDNSSSENDENVYGITSSESSSTDSDSDSDYDSDSSSNTSSGEEDRKEKFKKKKPIFDTLRKRRKLF